MSNRNRLSFKERIRIEAGIYAKLSFSRIARELGRQPSTIIREVKQNSLFVSGARPRGIDCVYAPKCQKKNLCGDEFCNTRCWTCREYNCTELCERHRDHHCETLLKPPFVCNNCKEKRRAGCSLDKRYYMADKAEAKAKATRSEARRGSRLNAEELRKLDGIISPLIKQGQPLSHICIVHRDELGVCERSVYNYVERGDLTIGNLDLRRKVKYRRRRKKQDTIPCNKFSYRKGRTYDDYQRYIEVNPDTRIVEMDTVKGKREYGKVLLTMIFTDTNLMLMFLMEDGTCESVIQVFDWLTKALGIRRFRRLFPLILTDNGGEFKEVLKLEFTKSGSPRTKLFYCDPQASWQKPHVEKNHEFIRYVIPKGTILTQYTQAQITNLSNNINSVKRAGLSNQSPFDLAQDKDIKKLLELMDMSPVPADDIVLTPKLMK